MTLYLQILLAMVLVVGAVWLVLRGVGALLNRLARDDDQWRQWP